ncbi:MAG: DUF6686 family protein [Bacteroidota bacterium]
MRTSRRGNNHQQNTLYEGREGYVVYCNCCQLFHIAYGTISFDQTETDLLRFMEVLSHNYNQYHDVVNPDCRCVQITTPFKGFRFLFSTNELQEFNEMLGEAYLLYEAERIMNSKN